MKKENIIGYVLIVLFMLLIVGISLISPKISEEDNELIEENQTEEELLDDETEDEKPKKIEKKEVDRKEYIFEGQKYIFSFNKLDEYYDFNEGELVYTSLVFDILKDDKKLFSNLKVCEVIDTDNEESDIKESIDSFMSELSHFDDVNGKKYLLFVTYNLDGGSHTIINLDTKEKLFSYSHSDIGDYNHEAFKDLEESLKVDLSKYFENDRNSLIVNNNLMGYFDLNEDQKELDYISVQVKNGKLDITREVIKTNLTEEELSVYYPKINSSL